MQRAVLFILLITATFTMSVGQEKVLEKSAKKSPTWVNAVEEGYIIASAYGADVEEAKRQLDAKIRDEIVNSVATYVRSNTAISIENINRGNVVNTVEKFQKTATIQAGDIPFLKGISLSKAEDYYWVKSQNKSTGKVSVTYHIKYPFSKADLHRLIKEFEEQDQAMTDKMNAIVDEIDRAESVEELDKLYDQLEQLNDYFIDSRKETTALEITRINQLIAGIDIQLIENYPGVLKYKLVIGEREIRTAQKPRIKKSECIEAITTERSGAAIQINYNYDNCYEDEANTIGVIYKFGNNKVEGNYPVEISNTMVELFVKDAIRLNKLNDDGNIINGFNCYIPLVAKYGGNFRVDKIVLDLPGKALIIEKVEAEFRGEGIHELTLQVAQTINSSDFNAPTGIEVNGIIYYTNLASGEQLRYKMFNQQVITDW